MPEALYGVYAGIAAETDVRSGRVRIEIPSTGTKGWARVAAPRIPRHGDEVLIAFEAGDPRHPYVVGALWKGDDRPPERA